MKMQEKERAIKKEGREEEEMEKMLLGEIDIKKTSSFFYIAILKIPIIAV